MKRKGAGRGGDSKMEEPGRQIVLLQKKDR